MQRRTPQEIAADCRLIDSLGGPAAVARALKLKVESGIQTVQNWKTRGIPWKVRAEHPDLFPQVKATKREKARAL